MLPASVIEEDRRLDQEESSAANELVALRWGWTLNDDNPARVTISAYARAVGKTEQVIRRDAHAYVVLDTASCTGTRIGVDEARARALMSAETAAATEAVADAHGVSFRQAHRSRSPEVRHVREVARQRAEERGTSVAEEAPKVADVLARSAAADRQVREQRNARRTARFLEVEGALANAERYLRRALDAARTADMEDEEIELLIATIAKVRALLALVDVAVAGTSDIDWDAELARLQED